jgi:YihY family inner membrane protein
MTTQAKDMRNQKTENAPEKVIDTAKKDTKPIMGFLTKFNNDWSMNLSAALAYNLLMAIFPIAIAVLSILGLILGGLSPTAYAAVKSQILHVFPSVISSQGIIDSISLQLKRSSGIFSIIAIILALFNGSRLFILMEGCFGIIYHVRQRKPIPQNIMAFLMLLLFIVLIPIMFVAATAPSFILGILQSTALGKTPGPIVWLFGVVGSTLAAYILFQAIYIVVPNQSISFRHSWLGSVVAAVLLQIYLILFPFYVSHFLTGYAASISSIILLLIFFYYFAVILMLGAEVNAFFAEGVTATPTDLVSLVHITTSHLPKAPEDKNAQAAASHKDAPTGDTAAKTHVDETVNNPDIKASKVLTTATAHATQQGQNNQNHQAAMQQAARQVAIEEEKAKKSKPKKSVSMVSTAIEAVAGTALAFVVELLRMRRRKLQ